MGRSACGAATSLSFAVPVMRTAWIEKRRQTISSGGNVTQLHYARAGVVTEEMAHVAKREKLPESLVMISMKKLKSCIWP